MTPDSVTPRGVHATIGDVKSEFEWIDSVRRRVAATERFAEGGVRLGIGDDAAVLAVPADRELVLTTDLLVEDVDFVLDGLDPRDLGWKCLAVSVSDVAAMGARAAHAVVSAAFGRAMPDAFADGLIDGLVECAERYRVAIVGGDTSGTPGGVVVNVALTGLVAPGRAVRRSGARPGDAICVTGALGGSILGRHLRPIPRQDEALSIVEQDVVHAMIDLSDGLSSDLGHVLDASGVGAEVWDDCVPIHADARRLAAHDGVPAIDHAWSDGEDFELLFCTDAATAARLARDGLLGTRVATIGRITADRAYVRRPSQGAGAARPVERRGHDHFRSA